MSYNTGILLCLIIVLPLLILYWVLLVKAIVKMLEVGANNVLLAFALLCLIPVPFFPVAGVLILFVWRSHKKHLSATG